MCDEWLAGGFANNTDSPGRDFYLMQMDVCYKGLQK